MPKPSSESCENCTYYEAVDEQLVLAGQQKRDPRKCLRFPPQRATGDDGQPLASKSRLVWRVESRSPRFRSLSPPMKQKSPEGSPLGSFD